MACSTNGAVSDEGEQGHFSSELVDRKPFIAITSESTYSFFQPRWPVPQYPRVIAEVFPTVLIIGAPADGGRGRFDMTARELEEYRALRATIRERGTARVWIFVVGFGLWGGLV